VYPAILSPDSSGGYTVAFPDLLGCVTEGDTLSDALVMASDAMSGWLYGAERHGDVIPPPSELKHVALESGETVSYVLADTDAYRKTVESFAVKKTLTIPSWLNEKAEAANVNFSKVLQDALVQQLV